MAAFKRAVNLGRFIIKVLIFRLMNPWQNSQDLNIYTKRKEQEQQFPDQIFYSHRLWLLLSKNDVHKEIYPNCFKLFKLLMIFPLSAACVERLFSKMKIVKNRLRNSLSNATLESLLLIATESPKAGFEDAFEDLVYIGLVLSSSICSCKFFKM